MVKKKTTTTSAESNVLNFVAKRQASIEKKRRSFGRVMFQNVLGVYTVVDAGGTIYPVELIDISYDGCLIQVPHDRKKPHPFQKGQELTLRFYFTKNSFIPGVVQFKRVQEYEGQDGRTYLRYGAVFDQKIKTFEALHAFIDFLYKFAEFSAVDTVQNKVFFL